MSSRTRVATRAAALALSAGLAATILGTGEASYAAASTSAAPLVSGVVTDGNGNPISDAVVTLIADASSDALAATAQGSAPPQLTLGTVTTGSSGAYSFNPDLTAVGSQFKDALSGVINMEVDQSSALGGTSYYLSAAAPSAAAASDPDVAVPGVTAAKLTFGAQTGTVTGTMGATAITPTSTDSTDSSGVASSNYSTLAQMDTAMARSAQGGSPYAADSSTGGPVGDKRVECTRFSDVQEYDQRKEYFTKIYSYGGHTDVNEAQGENTSLGVAFQVKMGEWGARGSATLTKRAAGGAKDTYIGNKEAPNYVNQEKQRRICRVYVNDNEVWKPTSDAWMDRRMVTLYYSEFNDHNASLGIQPVVWYRTNCFPESKPHVLYKIRGRDFDLAVGLDTPFVSVDSHTTYSKDMEVDWILNVTTFVCGNTNAGPQNAPLAGTTEVAYSSGGGGGCPHKCPSGEMLSYDAASPNSPTLVKTSSLPATMPDGSQTSSHDVQKEAAVR